MGAGLQLTLVNTRQGDTVVALSNAVFSPDGLSLEATSGDLEPVPTRVKVSMDTRTNQVTGELESSVLGQIYRFKGKPLYLLPPEYNQPAPDAPISPVATYLGSMGDMQAKLVIRELIPTRMTAQLLKINGVPFLSFQEGHYDRSRGLLTFTTPVGMNKSVKLYLRLSQSRDGQIKAKGFSMSGLTGNSIGYHFATAGH
jgi:hypothetical protein